MKILPPADETERRRLKESFETQLRQATGGNWRVYIVPGRYGWYARAVLLPSRSILQPAPVSRFVASP